jgi:hypothetical protein
MREWSGSVHPTLGPLVRVALRAPDFMAQDPNYGGATGLPVLAPVSGWAILDTGATQTCIARTVASRAPLLQHGALPIQGVRASTAKPVEEYSRRLYGVVELTDLGTQHHVSALEITDLPDPEGRLVVGLIGRDVLAAYHLSYDGPAAAFTLTLRVS